ncbi:MAG: AMP-binding protein [Clostridia bacterium]|nr:AMP-binding protein [Clostridia bacterium]
MDSLIYTSGTESLPKGVLLTHNTHRYTQRMAIDWLRLTPDDVVWMASPTTHATGLRFAVLMPVLLGMKAVLQESFVVEESVELIERERVTLTLAATPFLRDLAYAPNLERHDVSSLRVFGCGGAPVPRQLALDAKRRLGCRVLGAFGSTETSGVCFANYPDDPPEKMVWNDVDGRPIPGTSIRIVDDQGREVPRGTEGEIAVNGPCVCGGYFRRPDLNKQYFRDGWFLQGDLGAMDGDGYIRVTGRKKDIIIRGGVNISAREVEEILLTHPRVANAAVVAMPDPRLGERACAFVVPRGEPLTFEEMTAYLAERRVTRLKWPERLEIVPEFPMTPSGKIQKYVLRQWIADKVQGETASGDGTA